MINEASIIPDTQNWRDVKLPKQDNHYYNTFKNEFELSLNNHLEMIVSDGGNLEEAIDEMIKKFPNQNINKQYWINKFTQHIFE